MQQKVFAPKTGSRERRVPAPAGQGAKTTDGQRRQEARRRRTGGLGGPSRGLVLSWALWPMLLLGCSKQADQPAASLAQGTLVFEDTFERAELGDDWLDTGGGYRIVDGALRAQGAKNKPLWLKTKLPRDVRIVFTARSESAEVDIKAEVFGDGTSRATEASYTATSYVLILGGWNNRRSIIARMNEHGDDRAVRESPKGVQGKTYQFAIVRKGSRLSWFLDGEPFLEMNDPAPLAGPGHEHFGFNNWASEVFFDDLSIFAL